jgi:hypothetical protein
MGDQLVDVKDHIKSVSRWCIDRYEQSNWEKLGRERHHYKGMLEGPFDRLSTEN